MSHGSTRYTECEPLGELIQLFSETARRPLWAQLRLLLLWAHPKREGNRSENRGTAVDCFFYVSVGYALRRLFVLGFFFHSEPVVILT